MSTAPPGWHGQPDGRERFWDGQRWTDEFRDPVAQTQQIPLDDPHAAGQGASGGYGRGAYGPGPAAPPGQGPYAGQGDPYAQGGPLSDRPGGGGGPLKGCLIALAVVALLAVLLVIAAVLVFRAAGDRVSETIPTLVPTDLATQVPTELPTDLPTALPTDLPTTLPTDLPTLPSVPGQGETVTAGIGEAFALGGVTVQPGWEVSEGTLGFRTVTMSAVPEEQSTVPLLFNLTFLEGETELGSTVCTVPMGTPGEATDVGCVPLRADVDAADSVRAAGFGG
jgi:hypothetical protein